MSGEVELNGIGDDMERIRCPQCGYPDLVKGRVRVLGGIALARAARCVTCGFRFRVGRKTFGTLRYAAPGEPYGTVDDLEYYASHFQMTHAQVITVSTASVVLLVGGSWCAAIWGDWAIAVCGVVFLPVIYLSWWLGHWISPPERKISGYCTKCLYNLRGISGDRCPECGTTVDLHEARDGDTEAGK